VTRLVWVIIFALLIGALVIVSLRSLPGARITQRLVEVEQARETLSRLFPDSRFRIQFSTPNPGVRNLVVTIQPGRDLSRYDSLVIAVFDRVYRAVPTR